MKKRRSDGKLLVGRPELGKDSYLSVKYLGKGKRGWKTGEGEMGEWKEQSYRQGQKKVGHWL